MEKEGVRTDFMAVTFLVLASGRNKSYLCRNQRHQTRLQYTAYMLQCELCNYVHVLPTNYIVGVRKPGKKKLVLLIQRLNLPFQLVPNLGTSLVKTNDVYLRLGSAMAMMIAMTALTRILFNASNVLMEVS